MSKTLLDGLNEVLKAVNVIQGDSGLLTTLTDAGRQVYIDAAIRLWNETVDEIYSQVNESKPNQMAEATITLATGDRDYDLNASLIRLHFPLINEANGYLIEEYGGEYLDMMVEQSSGTYTGRPCQALIRPTDGALYLDRSPTSAENGLVYKYRYDKELVLTAADDEFPFNDAVFRALVPAVAERWKLDQNRTITEGVYRASMGRAARFLIQKPQRNSWLSSVSRGFDPYE